MKEQIFVTGGGGFVGSHLCRSLLDQGRGVTCYDKLDPRTVNPKTIEELLRNPSFKLIRGDILDLPTLESELNHVDAIIHVAAISSVDRSIKQPVEALTINTVGTLNVMEAARRKGISRVHYLSTDEVFGQSVNTSFNEKSPSNPRNPYSAGKLGGQAIMEAWGATYGMEVTVTNSVNNYGSYQAPEKLIPRLCVRGIRGNTLPVYGDGKQLREWIYVDDHVKAILHVLDHGTFGERYCVGTGEVHQNIEIVDNIIRFLGLGEDVIEHVPDRKGHDIGYTVDTSKLNKLGWKPEQSFSSGLEETIKWYKNNEQWWRYFMVIYPDLSPAREKLPLAV